MNSPLRQGSPREMTSGRQKCPIRRAICARRPYGWRRGSRSLAKVASAIRAATQDGRACGRSQQADFRARLALLAKHEIVFGAATARAQGGRRHGAFSADAVPGRDGRELRRPHVEPSARSRPGRTRLRRGARARRARPRQPGRDPRQPGPEDRRRGDPADGGLARAAARPRPRRRGRVDRSWLALADAQARRPRARRRR